ncbi:MAG: penicillin acylase family protein [Acidobacteria bacterium]|nr:penicillin acylase family protein [Acidobacteriota bacterium]
MRSWPIIGIVLMIFAISGTASFAHTQSESLSVSGLVEPVEILTDRWGIAHIYAENESDLFFAQGFNAARDRLFQFELWRRQATGTTAEILGSRALARDIGARLHMFRGDLKEELNHYHPRGQAIIEAFVAGINAYIAETKRQPDLLPIEFELLGITPEPWTPAIVISRHQGLVSNLTRELAYGRAVDAIGSGEVSELSWFRPGNPTLDLDPAIDGSLLTEDILETYRAFRRPVRFTPDDIAVEYRGNQEAFNRLASLIPSELDLAEFGDAIGSNNWVVGGSRTLSGYPLMANDPHRVQQAPSLRYWIHLVAPGWNVIGGGEPTLPGVSIGHNEYGAWGLTVFGQDNEDLYVYDTNPENAQQYRYRDSWEDMRVIEEQFIVEGELTKTFIELKFTRHGPVLYEDVANRKAYALRAAWMDIGSAPYLASLRMDQAASWEEFRDACSYSRLPSENMVWIDTDKNIGYQAVGVSPIRPNWSGLVPVPGDGRYEWNGYLPIEDLPQVFNPEADYFATANNFMVPENYVYMNALHYTWGDEMRAVRLAEVLGSGRRHTLVDMMQLQHDELSVPARNLVPLLDGVTITDTRIAAVRRKLLDWDFVLDQRSTEAAIYVAWERQLLDRVKKLFIPQAVQELLSLNMKRVIDWLSAPDGRFGPDPLDGRNALLVDTLSLAISNLESRLGLDMTQWQYGDARYKHALIRHPLGAAVRSDLRKQLDVGPVSRGGYGRTVNNTGNSDNQTSGASFRIIADSENWDNSVGTNSPGQSGDPDNVHYRDLFDLWARGQYFPIFYSREKVESVVEQTTNLEPAAASFVGR